MHKKPDAEVQATPVGEGEFKSAVPRISAAFADKDDWKKRQDALKELCALAMGDISIHDGCVALLSEHIKLQLNEQIRDNRSAIVKEACACVKALCSCSSVRHVWESMSDWFIEALVKDTCITVMAIATPADDAMKVVACCGALNRTAVNHILHACASKHKDERSHAFNYLLCMLLTLDPSVVARNGAAFVKAIRAGISDAVPEARKWARMCFWGLQEASPDHGAQLSVGLDMSAQKTVQQERSSYEAFANGVRGGAPPLAASVSPPPRPKVAAAPKQSKPVAAPAKVDSKATSRSQSASSDSAVPTHAAKPKTYGSQIETQSHASTTASRKPELAKKGSAFDFEHMQNDEEYLSLTTKAESADWATRCKAFERLGDFVFVDCHPARVSETIALTLKHMSDTHYKVVAAAIDCIDVARERAPDSCQPYLEKLLSMLLTKLSDVKELVRERTKCVLENLIRTYACDVLIPVLLKVLDSSNMRVRLACVEYILHLSQFAHEYMRTGTHLRTLILRLLNAVPSGSHSDAGRDVGKAVAACFASLHRSHHDIFIAQALLLNNADQASLKASCSRQIPQLDRELSGVSETAASAAPMAKRHVDPWSNHPSDDVLTAAHKPVNLPPAPAPLSSTPHALPQAPQARNRSPPQPSPPLSSVCSPPPSVEPSYNAGAYKPSAVNNADVFARKKSPSPPTPTAADAAPVIHQSSVSLPRSDHTSSAFPELSALRQASGNDDRRTALAQLQQNAHRQQEQWLSCDAAVPTVVDACRDTDHAVRCAALQLLNVVLAQPTLRALGARFVSDIFPAAAELINDPFPEVSKPAEVVGLAVLTTVPLNDGVRLLCNALSSALGAGRKLQIVGLLRVLENLLRGGKDLLFVLPMMEAPLTKAFTHEASEVRKCVVLCYVGIFVECGEDALPYMKKLSVSQLKLISIYVGRHFQDRNRTNDLPTPAHNYDLVKMMQERQLL